MGGGEEGLGVEQNHTTPQESLVLFKSFNTLWNNPYGWQKSWARTFKCLWGPGIDAKEWIPPAYVV